MRPSVSTSALCAGLPPIGARRLARRARLAVALAALLAGCEGPRPGGAALQLGSLEEFRLDVEPRLELRCAQGGCHGRPDRPLSLYAPGQYRRDPARTHLDEALDPVELERNAQAIAALGLSAASLAASPLFTKPLALSDGGVWHGGGDVFVDRSDPMYEALLRWVGTCSRAGADGGP